MLSMPVLETARLLVRPLAPPDLDDVYQLLDIDLVKTDFQHLNLKRVIATTDYYNQASIGVMHKLGMRIERNPLPEPRWMQVVGVIENPVT